MMDINQQFPSKFIKEADLQGKPQVLTMARITVEAMEQSGSDTKPVVYFQGAKKGLALNVTNKNVLVLLYGAETDNWIGKQIELYPSQTDFRGEVVACIRCRAPGAIGALGAAPVAAPLPIATPAVAPGTASSPLQQAADKLGQAPTDGGHTPTVTAPFQPPKEPERPMSDEISDEIPF